MDMKKFYIELQSQLHEIDKRIATYIHADVELPFNTSGNHVGLGSPSSCGFRAAALALSKEDAIILCSQLNNVIVEHNQQKCQTLRKELKAIITHIEASGVLEDD